jgi:hypothetical protein
MLDTLVFHALRAIGLTQALVAQMFNLATEPGDRLMRVTEVQRDRLRLHDGRAEALAQTWPTLRLALQMQDDALVVATGSWPGTAANSATPAGPSPACRRSTGWCDARPAAGVSRWSPTSTPRCW